jgi:hypothetical protein
VVAVEVVQETQHLVKVVVAVELEVLEALVEQTLVVIVQVQVLCQVVYQPEQFQYKVTLLQ